MQVFFPGLMQLIVQGFVSGKRIWIIENDDYRLVKFQEVQQCWETNAEAPVLVHLQPDRYTHAEKWHRATCTGTPQRCTGTPMQKSGREQPVPVHLQLVPVHLS